MRSALATTAYIGLFVSTGAVPLLAQMRDNTEKQMTCNNRTYAGDRAQHCDIREQTLPSTGRLSVEGHNGAATIKGWLRSDVLVRARVESAAGSQAAADQLASQVSVDSAGGQVRSTGPDSLDDAWWSVSYEIFVPQATDLSVTTHNGEVAISDVRGQIRFDAHNGAVSLKRLAGDVGGETHNGEIHVELMGSLWEGRQLEVSSHNGGISVAMPAGYSAHVQAETDRGRVQSDFPITVTGELRSGLVDTDIGSGGSLIHLTTHNGEVTLKRVASQ
ncbi:MAG TPA: DUF4097 family beta strand repeat-containing protein [Bryobacteraceae bacterium]|nr:DUF4097 family beta strand repeat-containing protein [Bryobacteraceae bacterium]